MHFGATLRLLRTDARVSLRMLAQAVGVSSAYLSRVENGHDPPPTPDRLVAIARALRLPPPLLIELANRVTPFVASYLERAPAAAALFVEIARRGLTGPQLARVQAFIDAEFPSHAPQGDRTAPRLSALLTVDRVVLRLSCRHFDDVIDVAAARLGGADSGVEPSSLAAALLRREHEAASALGESVAVPHAVIPSARARAALVTLAEPLAAPTPDGKPLKVFVVLILERIAACELQMLAQVARLASPGIADAIARAPNARAALREVELSGL